MQIVHTDKKDFTLSNLREMIADGDIIPDPDYQRNYVFDDNKASRLIESILIGIPIPTVYLSQEEDDSYTVIDGQQRITSIRRYLDNEFALRGLEELRELNSKKYKDLPREIQRQLKSSTLNCIVILKDSNELKYEIFARLNIGSVKLKPQELRNCIYRGPLNTMIEEVAESNKLLPGLFLMENVRKEYQERILRFFALRNYLEYKSSLAKTMNAFMEKNRNLPEDEIERLKKEFNGTIDIVKQVLGVEAFCAYDREQGKMLIKKFSGSVYDSIVVAFSRFSKHELMAHSNEIREAIFKLKKEDDEYQSNTYAATGSRKRVIGRIEQVVRVINGIIEPSTVTERRCFSHEIKQMLYKDGMTCSYCGNTILSIDDAEVDHIVPFSEGGATDISNAQLLHRHCNRTKNNAMEDEDWEGDDESSITVP